MRVGFFLGELQNEKIGGGYTFQMNIIGALKKVNSNHEFYFYYISDKNLFKNTENIKFINLKNELSLKFKKLYFFNKKKRRESNLNILVKRDKIELVYFITPIYSEVDVPFVLTVWDICHRNSGQFPEVLNNNEYKKRENFYSNVIPKASFVVIGNNEGKRQICKYYNAVDERVKTFPMPTPNYVYDLKEDVTILKKHHLEKEKYLFYPAQFWAHKNHIRLLKALQKLKEQGSDLKLVLTGSDQGNKEYINKKIKEYNIENEVLILGFISKEELIALYKNAFALTYSSFFGPDNIPPLEAMALQCPVISSGTAGMKEQLGDCALFFDPKDENSLIEQIEKLNDRNLRNELIAKGEILAKKYSTENYIKHMLKLIDDFEPIRECWE